MKDWQLINGGMLHMAGHLPADHSSIRHLVVSAFGQGEEVQPIHANLLVKGTLLHVPPPSPSDSLTCSLCATASCCRTSYFVVFACKVEGYSVSCSTLP